jgi:hypothetical protein
MPARPARAAPLDCNDNNPCTDDSCAKAKGCLHLANSGACSDGDACTKGDLCQDSACKSGAAVDCNDDNPCSDDSCDKVSGCDANATCQAASGKGCACNQGYLGDGKTCAKPETQVCASADEGGSVQLACPQGMVIGAVTFSSYGMPQGECGQYATTACHAQDSVGGVAGLCAGKPACTVAADNATFGDPCEGVAKHMYVQVGCVGQ